MPACSCIAACGADNFQKLIADSQQGVRQPELCDFGIAVNLWCLQSITTLRNCRLQLACGEHDLTDSQTHLP
jgi:hypothetical protein